MANNSGCGCGSRRNSNSGYGCLRCLGGRDRWENYPYYNGPCPSADGDYDWCRDRDDDRCCPNRKPRGGDFGIFTAMLPMAVAANGIVPLVGGNCNVAGGFNVNSGLITIEEAGVYLATSTVRVPEEADVKSTFTLNVNDASQSPAITQTGGTGPVAFTSQAIFEVNDRATLAVRTSEAIDLATTSQQPLVTLTLVRIG